MAKVEPKFQVKENSLISDIYSKLNNIQKKAIVLFDTDRSGTMDAKECKAFNNSVFSEQANGDLDVYIQLSSGKKQKITVKQDEFDNTVLSIERTQKEKIEERNGKKVKIITSSDELQKQKGESISQKINSQLHYVADESGKEWKKVSVDKNGNTKYEMAGLVEYYNCDTQKDEQKSYKNYAILDKSGNVIEAKTALIYISDNGDYLYGSIKNEGDKCSYYDSSDSLVGTEEYQEDGAVKISDEKGKVLYYRNVYDYYDANKKLRYSIQPSEDAINQWSKAIMYDDNGNVRGTKRVIMPYGETPLDQFQALTDSRIGEFDSEEL